MLLVLGVTLLVAVLGWFALPRLGLAGFVLVALIGFLTQFGINAATGFEGSSWEDSLLLFNGSVVSYLGFNAQITYRAFALPLFVLGLVATWRMRAA